MKKGYIRYKVANELALSNPSLKLHDQQLSHILSSLKPPTHPPYASMIETAIATMNEKEGTSESEISKFIAKTYENLPLAHEAILKHHLRKLCRDGEIMRTVNELFVLPSNGSAEKGAIDMNRKKRKRGRERGIKIGRPSKVKSRGKDDGDTGEEIQPMEREVGKDDMREELGRRCEESIIVVEDQSEAERDKSEKMSSKLHDEISNEAKDEVGQNLDEKHNEAAVQLKEVVAQVQQLGISSEKSEPNSKQTELTENQLQSEGIQNHLREFMAELALPDPSSESQQLFTSAKPKKPSLLQPQKHNEDETQRRKLRSYYQQKAESNTAVTMTKSPLPDDQTKLLDEEKQSQPPKLLESNIQWHENEPLLKRCPGTKATKSLLPSPKQKLQGENLYLTYSRSERVLRSHCKKPIVSDSPFGYLNDKQAPIGQGRGRAMISKPNPEAADSTAVVVFEPPDDFPRKERRGRPRKFDSETNLASSPANRRGRPQEKLDSNSAAMVIFRPPPDEDNDNSNDVKLKLKRNAKSKEGLNIASLPVKRNSRLRPRKTKAETDLNDSDVSLTSSVQLPKQNGRGRPRKKLDSNSAAMVIFRPPPDEDDDSSNDVKLKLKRNAKSKEGLNIASLPVKRNSRLRPRKAKAETDLNDSDPSLTSAVQLPKQNGRGRSQEKLDSNSAAMVIFRPPSDEEDDSSNDVKLKLKRNAKSKEGLNIASLPVKRYSRLRPRKAKAETDLNNSDPSLTSAVQLPKQNGRGRPRKPRPETMKPLILDGDDEDDDDDDDENDDNDDDDDDDDDDEEWSSYKGRGKGKRNVGTKSGGFTRRN